ncbi:sugar phosphate isomerase/epimerase family protein [Adhaeretor mobilis]|uniref:L-ribulose-5-phosphate 3-epimerase UlaE n=1 Tax=Adhaeretor mobilis TaxID=1930276 RepID=A0A517MXP8_9BACT|nr:sugar phosphate isomerase/epimerase family protein [Adhaeretor mobilis]QDS99655.1 L-ribulose-5-phosphate 3-epimerase UlaE [Adhaeretor mobilis]
MLLGYNTNGLAHHSLPAAIELLAGLGYRSVAITLDHGCLNPYSPYHEKELQEASGLLKQYGLSSVIETGARFLLNPSKKHQPTLLSPRAAGRPRRIEFLRHAIDTAAALGSDCVSLWSGALPKGDSRENGMRRLVESLKAVLDYAERRDVTLGFEPEPGMLIDTMDAYGELIEKVECPRLQLTLDIGHLHCQGETPIAEVIERWHERLVNVHIEDMNAGTHEHLMFGAGEIDFPDIVEALERIDYQGGVHVELSRHSHVGPTAAMQAITFLKSLLKTNPK